MTLSTGSSAPSPPQPPQPPPQPPSGPPAGQHGNDDDVQSNESQVNQVLAYRRLGWWVIDAALRSKVPNDHGAGGWQNQRLEEKALRERFATPQNVSLLLGVEPKVIVDVDFDTPEAVRAAFGHLPTTGAMFGRHGRGLSHYLYEIDHVPRSMFWKVDGKKIIELRSVGHQTIIPNSIHPSGAAINWIDPESGRIQSGWDARPGEPALTDFDALKESIDYVAAVACLAEAWRAGSRHDAAFSLAGGLARSGYPRESALAFIQHVCEVAGDEDEAVNHERSIAVNDTYNKWEAGEKQLRGWPSLEEMLAGNGRAVINAVRNWLHLTLATRSDDNRPPLNDSGNADRFTELFHGDLRFNEESRTWLAWEGTRWKTDRASTALYLARQVGIEIQKDAANILDRKQQEEMWRFGQDCGNQRRLVSMVNIAQSRPEFVIRSEDLDSDPADINFINCTYNLERGSHRPHRQEDMISRLSPVRWDPLVKADARWEAFLDDVTAGDQTFRRYLQKAAGLSMTGYTREEVLFIAHGPAATGKTTFLETLRAVLGDYAAVASPETFLHAPNMGGGGSARPDLVKLLGKRFVTASEIDEGRRLAHSVVKTITGGDTITARNLYQGPVEFRPVCKVWIATNNDPGIIASDKGMWRRIHVLNFKNEIPPERQDRTLKGHLTDMNVVGPAIINWMIEGFRLYKEEGLTKPDIVRNATDEYRDQQDFMADFFGQNCVLAPDARTMGNALMERYLNWAQTTGNPRLATNVLAQRFRDHGLYSTRGAKGKVWHGVRLLDQAELYALRANVQSDDKGVAD